MVLEEFSVLNAFNTQVSFRASRTYSDVLLDPPAPVGIIRICLSKVSSYLDRLKP